MNRILNACLICCVMTFVSGCSTLYRPVSHNYKMEEGNKEGLVVVSFEMPSSDVDMFSWYYHELGNWDKIYDILYSKHYFRVLRGDKEISYDGRGCYYDNNILVAYRLPEGKYEFVSWWEAIDSRPFTIYKNPKDNFSIPFNVIAGKAVYIGRLNRKEFEKAKTSTITVSDNREKDIQVFKKCYPNVRDDQIEVHLMEYNPIKWTIKLSK